MSQPTDYNVLVANYLDDNIEPTDFKILEAWLTKSPENLEWFIQHVAFHLELRQAVLHVTEINSFLPSESESPDFAPPDSSNGNRHSQKHLHDDSNALLCGRFA